MTLRTLNLKPAKWLRYMGRPSDTLFWLGSLLCALAILGVMLAILASLINSAWPAIRHFGFGFLTSKSWDPVRQHFGALSSVWGTLGVTAIAMLIAVPMSVVIAIFLVEIAPPRVAAVVGNMIELLAAIPSIIYGMWGLFVFAPVMAKYVQPVLKKLFGFLPFFTGATNGIGMLTAGIILALMVLPFMTTVMRDVFKMVPPVIRESAYGMGATRWEMTRIVLRYGARGLLGAGFLGMGRAIGETMAVTFVIGNAHRISLSVFSEANSIASTLANEFAEASEPLYLSVLIELGLVLFAITLIVQIVAHLWLKSVERALGAKR